MFFRPRLGCEGGSLRSEMNITNTIEIYSNTIRKFEYWYLLRFELIFITSRIARITLHGFSIALFVISPTNYMNRSLTDSAFMSIRDFFSANMTQYFWKISFFFFSFRKKCLNLKNWQVYANFVFFCVFESYLNWSVQKICFVKQRKKIHFLGMSWW